jgi:hypothetical protein
MSAEKLHEVANDVRVPDNQELAIKYLEGLRAKVDQLIQGTSSRIAGSN